jgi:hypothetical protein
MIFKWLIFYDNANRIKETYIKSKSLWTALIALKYVSPPEVLKSTWNLALPSQWTKAINALTALRYVSPKEVSKYTQNAANQNKTHTNYKHVNTAIKYVSQ